MFPVVIHHNPDCGTSRNVLTIIKAAGYEPEVIEYLKTGWSRPQLVALFAAANLTPRAALRETKSPAKDLGLLEPAPFQTISLPLHSLARGPSNALALVQAVQAFPSAGA